MENESEKKENEVEEEEINGEAKMDETSEGNEVGEVEQMRESKKKRTRRSKRKEIKSSQFSDKTVTSIGRKLEKQYGRERQNI